MNALVTGSHVYGTPKPDSDIDLVVLVTKQEIKLLRKLADEDNSTDYENPDYGVGGLTASLRFGKLNLLCCTDPAQVDVWRRGTDALKLVRPVTRDQAVATFQQLQRDAGLNKPHVPGGLISLDDCDRPDEPVVRS